MTETELRENIRDAAKKLGWGFYHTWTSLHSAKGFPDLVLVRAGHAQCPGRVIFAELKTDIGKTSPEQDEWLAALAACPGVEVYLFRPADWDSGEIARVLSKEGRSG